MHLDSKRTSCVNQALQILVALQSSAVFKHNARPIPCLVNTPRRCYCDVLRERNEANTGDSTSRRVALNLVTVDSP